MYRYLLIALPVLFLTWDARGQGNADSNMLDGPVTRKQIQRTAWFVPAYKKYSPDPEVVNELRKKKKGVTVEIVLGTWCSDSKEEVPKFLKVLDAMKLSSAATSYVAVDRKKTSRKVDMAHLKIEQIPVFIIYMRGAEIGRIIETPEKTPEADLLKILSAAPPEKT
jgi:hypothetical protein